MIGGSGWENFRGTGYEGQKVCRWCGGPFQRPRQRTFCSTACRTTYFRLFSWPDASRWALQRAHYRCQYCGMSQEGIWKLRRDGDWRWPSTIDSIGRRLEVHHVVPMNGQYRAYSILNLPYNLRVACPECHDARRRDFDADIAEMLYIDGGGRYEREP